MSLSSNIRPILNRSVLWCATDLFQTAQGAKTLFDLLLQEGQHQIDVTNGVTKENLAIFFRISPGPNQIKKPLDALVRIYNLVSLQRVCVGYIDLCVEAPPPSVNRFVWLNSIL